MDELISAFLDRFSPPLGKILSVRNKTVPARRIPHSSLQGSRTTNTDCGQETAHFGLAAAGLWRKHRHDHMCTLDACSRLLEATAFVGSRLWAAAQGHSTFVEGSCQAACSLISTPPLGPRNCWCTVLDVAYMPSGRLEHKALGSQSSSAGHIEGKEKFTLFSDHNGSLSRRQPGAMTIGHSPKGKEKS